MYVFKFTEYKLVFLIKTTKTFSSFHFTPMTMKLFDWWFFETYLYGTIEIDRLWYFHRFVFIYVQHNDKLSLRLNISTLVTGLYPSLAKLKLRP